MDEKSKNGQKAKIQGTEGTLEFNCDTGNQRPITGDSGSDEAQSKRVAGKMGQSLVGDGISGADGGISSLLRGITKDFVDYLDAHGERLETRLIENKKAKSNILKQAAALENELAKLLEQAEYLPEDSTEEE